MNINILNNELSVTVSTTGAELQSIKKDGKELLWQGNPDVWSFRAPLLFPICGGLLDNKFIFEGKEYTLPKHGFGRFSEFEAEKISDNTAVFVLKSDESTLKCYPFEFELKVTYKIDGSKLYTTYDVKNLSDKTMYYSIGSHEAFDCPEGIEAYTVIFEKPETLAYNSLVPEGQLKHETTSLGDNMTELPLKCKYFEDDALVFTSLKSRKVTLRNNITGYCIDVSFPGKDYFLLWTKPSGQYICIEPWKGIADYTDSDYDITHKPGIIAVPVGETDSTTHTITF